MELTTTQVQRLVGIDCYRTLDEWVRSGLLPVVVPARGPGRGRARGWSFVDLLCAQVIADLRRAGTNTEDVARVVSVIHAMWHDGLGMGQERLVIAKDKTYWVLGEEAMLEAIQEACPSGLLVVLGIGRIATELRLKLFAIQEKEACNDAPGI